MHRPLGRGLRGACRILRENECPMLSAIDRPSTEEVFRLDVFPNPTKDVLKLKNRRESFQQSYAKFLEILEKLNYVVISNETSRWTGDLMSAVGACKFLSIKPEANQESVERDSWNVCPNNKTEEPRMTAMEIMKKGADLGSSRALYNIGVAYERLNEIQIAKEYYQKSADLGHPLATYNNAVFLLKDGQMSKGWSMMRIAAENGVPEAQWIKNIL